MSLTTLNFNQFVGEFSYDEVRGWRGRMSPTWNDLVVLLRLAEKYQPVNCLEIGIHDGNTARLLLADSDSIEHYVGVDCLRKATPQAGHLVARDSRVTLLLRPKGTKQLAHTAIPCRPFDWIFIDADHNYEPVKSDTKWALRMLDYGGVMIWHDYDAPSQYRPGGPVFGVKKWLDEFARGAGVNLNVFDDPLHTSSIGFMRQVDK